MGLAPVADDEGGEAAEVYESDWQVDVHIAILLA
jgi:hypothetical protein